MSRNFSGRQTEGSPIVNSEQLMVDFQKDIARWNRENLDS
jgi:hypothetical protein